MPTVRRFDRCRIEMYFRDHPPPHFHVVTRSNERVAVLIETLESWLEPLMHVTSKRRSPGREVIVKRCAAYGGNTRAHHESQRR